MPFYLLPSSYLQLLLERTPGWLRWGLLLSVCMSLSVVTSAQNKIWDKTLGGTGDDRDVITLATPDGGFLVAGSSNSGQGADHSQASRGGNDYWAIKLDKTGQKQWDRRFGGESLDLLTALLATPDGGYLLGGLSYSGIGGDKTEVNQGDTDYWIVKMDAKGNKEWDKTLGGNFYDELSAVVNTTDGGYLLGGISSSGISGDKSEKNRDPWAADTYSYDYWIVKLNNAGQKEWDKTYGGEGFEDWYGGDLLSAIENSPDGGYLLGGTSQSDDGAEKSQKKRGGYDYWVIKVDATGQKVWDKVYGGTNGDNGESYRGDVLADIVATADGGYLLAGSSDSEKNGDKSEVSVGYSDFWIIRIDEAGNKIWDQTLGGNDDEGLKAVVKTAEGHFVLAGFSDSGIGRDKNETNRGSSDYWVIKTDDKGRKIWDKTYGTSELDVLSSITLADDGYLLAGWTDAADGDKTAASRGDNDFWLVKVKEESTPVTTQWNRRYGGAGKDNFTGVLKTTDGGYLAGGYTESSISGDKSQASQGKNDYWIVKSDQNGNKLWDKRYGGSADDYLNRVIQTQDGGYLLAGSSYSGQNGDKSEASRGDRDYWLVKVDAKGHKEWDKTYGGSGQDELVKVVQLASGEYVLGGSSNSPVSGDKTQPSQGGTDLWLVKISASGTKLWDKRYGGPASESLGSLTGTSDGGFFLGSSTGPGKGGDKTQPGWKGSDVWAVKTDQEGNLLWEKTLGGFGQEGVFSVRQISGGNLYLAGSTNSRANGEVSQTSRGGYDYWLVLLDKEGTKLWDKRFGGSKDDVLRASTYTPEGHIILAGISYSGISGDKNQNNQGGGDYWVVEVDENGQKVQDQRFGGSGDDELRTVTLTKDGGLLLGGRSNSGESGDRTQPSQGRTDYWLVKVAPRTTSVVAARTATMTEEAASVTEVTPLTAYPNPFQERVSIRFSVPQTQPVTVRVLDGQGKAITTLFQQEAKANQTYQVDWEVQQQANGLYLLQLQTSTKRNTRKLLLNK